MNKKMNLLNEAQSADYVFISVMGPHANESPNEIFKRKTGDLDKCGESFWVSKINHKFIEECKKRLNGEAGYLVLVESSNNGKNAVNTKVTTHATHYSKDKTHWDDIDAHISPVTGNLGNGATAYYYDALELCGGKIDLDYYSEDNKIEAIRFILGKSNVFAKKNATPMSGGMASHERKIIAVLRLLYPYVVWVK